MQLENYGQSRKCEFPPGEEGPSFLVQATELVLRISQQMVTTAQLPWRRAPPPPPSSLLNKEGGIYHKCPLPVQGGHG